MIETEITISLIIVYVLQVLSLPLQLFAYVAKWQTRSSVQLLILSIIFLVSNTTFLFYGYHLNDDLIPVICLKTLVICVHVYFIVSYLQHRITLKIPLKALHTFLLILFVFIFFKSFLSEFILPSKLLQVRILVIVFIQLVVSVFTIHVIRQITACKKYSSLEEKLILLLLSVLSFAPVAFEIIANQVIQFLTVNIIFFSLFGVHLVELLKESRGVLLETLKDQENVFLEYAELPKLSNQIEQEVESVADSIMKEYDLSSRQLAVLRFVLEGKNYREISRKLNIEHSTARKHGTNIYKKVGVKGVKSLRRKFSEIDWKSLPEN